MKKIINFHSGILIVAVITFLTCLYFSIRTEVTVASLVMSLGCYGGVQIGLSSNQGRGFKIMGLSVLRFIILIVLGLSVFGIFISSYFMVSEFQDTIYGTRACGLSMTVGYILSIIMWKYEGCENFDMSDYRKKLGKFMSRKFKQGLRNWLAEAKN